MVKRFALLGTVAFCLLTACIAPAQSKVRPADSQLIASSKTFSVPKQGQSTDAGRVLPDAPSAQNSSTAEFLVKASGGSRLPLAAAELATPAALDRELLKGIALPEAPSASGRFQAVPQNKQSTDFLSKYLNVSRAAQGSLFQNSSSDKLMVRATDAASRVFLMRDPTGKAHVNTAYFLRVLTSVAAENASRRYRARSGTAPLSNFGSTVGNDAGMNVLHEFAPNIRQTVAGHLPETLSRLGQHFSRLNAR